MKRMFASVVVLSLGFAVSAMAEEKVTISGVHNCCKKCEAGITKGVSAGGSDVKATIEKTSVTLTAASVADLQKAVDGLVAAGYTGTSDNAAVKVCPGSADDANVKSLTVSGVHLCCGKCVAGVQKALKTVPGVTGDTVTKGAESFKVEGDFNAKAVMAALAQAGYTGKATK